MEKEKEKKKIVLFFTFGAFCVLVFVVGLFLGGGFGCKCSTASTASASITSDGSTSDGSTSDGATTAGGSGGINIPGFDSMTFIAGQQAQAVKLENPAENECYMVFTIKLPDGTQLYQSGMIAPGASISQIYLDVIPEAGTYADAVLLYDCYDLSDAQTQLNGAEVKFLLEVVEQ